MPTGDCYINPPIGHPEFEKDLRLLFNRLIESCFQILREAQASYWTKRLRLS
jgi:hypothetical protein